MPVALARLVRDGRRADVAFEVANGSPGPWNRVGAHTRAARGRTRCGYHRGHGTGSERQSGCGRAPAACPWDVRDVVRRTRPSDQRRAPTADRAPTRLTDNPPPGHGTLFPVTRLLYNGEPREAQAASARGTASATSSSGALTELVAPDQYRGRDDTYSRDRSSDPEGGLEAGRERRGNGVACPDGVIRVRDRDR